ncbi:MAG: hypothetical protein GC186_05275 [Rhodobacteraceae bacterium]|nr:hypothetical protein [Paracoccaceae bacterium]
MQVGPAARRRGFGVAAILATLVLAAAPAQAALQLIMFEQPGCPWCARWDAAIAPIYPKTTEGAEAPLTRMDIHAALPADIKLARAPQFTPTFVLLQDGSEVGRIEGYPGEDFFWGMLDGLLARAVPPLPTGPKT